MTRFLFLLLFALTRLVTAQDRIQYIANEGIHIQSNDKHVLIDALFDNYYPDYLHPTEEVVGQMINSDIPFERVDLFLSTHAHRDHFYSVMVSDFLVNHPETQFISTSQALDSIKTQTDLSESLASQILGYDRSSGWKEYEKSGLKVKSAFVRHGGRQNYNVDNLIYLLKLGGKQVLHLGDSEMDAAHFRELALEQESITVALVPYWFLAYPPGIDIINNHIKPLQLIGIHYPKVGDPKSLKAIKANFPDAIVFKNTGEVVDF